MSLSDRAVPRVVSESASTVEPHVSKRMPDLSFTHFALLVEVVPPTGSDAAGLLGRLAALHGVQIDAFTVASNPVATPRMSALALSALVRRRTGRAVVMHCTTRDHNRLSAWSNLCGAKALGIESVLVATGDFVALGERARTTTLRDLTVYDLVEMARSLGLQTGVVFDPGDEARDLDRQVDRLHRKAEAGAQFAVTQPLFDERGAEILASRLAGLQLPIVMGILPLRSVRHARFLNERVAGITVPPSVRQRLSDSAEPAAEGSRLASEMLELARRTFSGACIMPALGHYETVAQVLAAGQCGRQSMVVAGGQQS